MKPKAVILNGAAIGWAEDWDQASVAICDYAFRMFKHFNRGGNLVSRRARCLDMLAQTLTGNDEANSDALILTDENSAETETEFQVNIKLTDVPTMGIALGKTNE